MNRKIIAILMVAVLVSVAAFSVFIINKNDSEGKTSKGSGRALVYGNADNDDYLDNEDLDLVNKIVESGDWDKEKYPFADANCDGKVDSADIDYLKKILNKEKVKLYYIGYKSETYYVNYPNTGNIAISLDYGLMMAQVLGIYDRITAGSSKVLEYSESRYPGVRSLINLGTNTTADYATFVENLLGTDCTLLLGRLSPGTYDMLRASGKEVDHVLFSSSAEIGENDTDVVSDILTCGMILDAGDKAREYAKYFDEMKERLSIETSGVTKKSYLCIYNPNNAVTTSVHTSGDNGSSKGDSWTLSHLPLYSDFKWNGTAANGKSNNVEVESLIKMDPEIIVISIWNKAYDDSKPAEVQAIFDEVAKYFKETNAYKNGKVYGINYEMYGTYLGIGGLALLASYIWPDDFNEDEGWELLQEAIDRFTLIEGDVKNLGGMIPYKVNTTS